jgi:Polyketide cyclase / dehydrase and lipid transport
MADERDDKGGVAAALPTDALREAGQQLLSLLVQRATEAAAQRVTGLADRLTDVTDSGGDFRAVLGGKAQHNGQVDDADDDADDDDDGKPGGLKGALVGLKDKMKNAFGGGGGSGGAKKLKMTSIIESVDVGLPLRTTYDTWTQFADFPSFMKKVETVEQESDEKTNWTAKVFWSRRTWEATIVEQVPDSHIVWRSTGAKGHVDGAVGFTELGPNLTRVLLVLEYWPQGFFERTGNLWRAQGRRARLEFKHFRRHAMTNVLLRQEEVEGWRGEIRDSEVVKTHEEALEEEQAQQQESASTEDEPAQDETTEETGPEEATEEVAEDETAPEDDEVAEDDEGAVYDEEEPEETDDEYGDQGDEYTDEADEYAEGDEYDEGEEGDEGVGEPAPARSGRRG